MTTTRPFGWTAHAEMVACAVCHVAYSTVNREGLCRKCVEPEARLPVQRVGGSGLIGGWTTVPTFRQERPYDPVRDDGWGASRSPLPAGVVEVQRANCPGCGYPAKVGEACPKC